MPIDASIYARIPIPQAPSYEELQEARLKNEQLQQKRADEAQARRDAAMTRAALSASMQEDGSINEKVLTAMLRGNPGALMAIQKQLDERKKATAERRKAEIANAEQLATQSAQALNGVLMAPPEQQASLYQSTRQQIAQYDPDTAASLGETPDPAAIQAAVNRFTTLAQAETQRKNAVDLLLSGKGEEYLGRVLPLAQSAEQWDDELLGAAIHMGVPLKSLKARYGAFSPANQQRAASMSMTAKDRTELANTMANTAADNARQNAQLEISRGQLAVSQGQLDVARGNLAARKAEGAQGAGGAKLSATAIEKVAGVDQSMGMIADIEAALPSMLNHIGIYDGRVAKAKLATGAKVDQALAEFAAQITGLKNAVIKATTGAAMSEPEAQRIMGQLPDLAQPEAVFKARLATTKRNLETLKRRTIELSGGTVEAPSKSGSSQKIGRFEVTVD